MEMRSGVAGRDRVCVRDGEIWLSCTKRVENGVDGVV